MDAIFHQKSDRKSNKMPNSRDAEGVLLDLSAGNERFLEGKSKQNSESSLKKLKDFSKKGQFPKAIVLCCSDSRAPVEMIFDQDIGDLFVIRVAGNVVAPSLVGSVEFAVSTFDTKLVLVMGHTQCGAIKSTIDHANDTQSVSSANIFDIVSRIKPHIMPILRIKNLSEDEKIEQAVIANVYASVSQLSHSSQMIETLVEQKEIKIVGAVLGLDTGKVEFLE